MVYVLGLEVVEDGVHDRMGDKQVVLHELPGSVDHLVPWELVPSCRVWGLQENKYTFSICYLLFQNWWSDLPLILQDLDCICNEFVTF